MNENMDGNINNYKNFFNLDVERLIIGIRVHIRVPTVIEEFFKTDGLRKSTRWLKFPCTSPSMGFEYYTLKNNYAPLENTVISGMYKLGDIIYTSYGTNFFFIWNMSILRTKGISSSKGITLLFENLKTDNELDIWIERFTGYVEKITSLLNLNK